MTKLRRGVFVAGLLASSALGKAAMAQEYFPPALPPIRETVDDNGVDLTRGTLVSRSHGVSIGGQGGMGLAWSRTLTGSGGFRDSTGIVITYASSLYTVAIGGYAESFNKSGSNFISIEKTGATLVTNGSGLTYTSADGTVFNFVNGPTAKKQYGGLYSISSIVAPTGERQDFHYAVVSGVCIPKFSDPCFTTTSVSRLNQVTSNNGYALWFDFEEPYLVSTLDETQPWMSINKVTAYNMSVDRCDPTNPVCTFSKAWPSLTIGAGPTFTDSLNRTTTYTYAGGALTAIKRPGAASNNYTASYTSGKVTSVTNNGVTTGYAYADVSGVRTTTISDAVAGNREVKTTLSTMLVASDKNELGNLTAYEYYATSGLLKKVTAPELNTAEFEYDARGNRTKTTLTPKPGSPLSPIVSQMSYPASDATQTWRCATGITPQVCNKPLTSTDPRLSVTDYSWDSTHGQLLSVTAPAPTTGAVRPQTRIGYGSVTAQYKNASGSLVNFGTSLTRPTSTSECQTLTSCSGAADEVKSTITYGTANALPVAISKGSGDGVLTATVAVGYDEVGNAVTSDGPLSGTADTTRTLYDAARQQVGTIGPDPDDAGALKNRAVRITYNADGQVTKTERGTTVGQTDPAWAAFTSLEAVDTAYDVNSRPSTVALAAGGTTYSLTQTSYDSIGRPECQAVRMNSATFGALPASACTMATTGSFGPDRISKVAYDGADQPLTLTVALGTAEQATEVTMTYSANGRTATVKDGENNLTTAEYDGFDRLEKTRFPVTTQGANSSSTTDYSSLTYDAGGNITAQRLRDGQSIGFTFDKLNRVTAKDLPSTEPDVSYAYDNLGRLTSASQLGHALSFTFDALSRNLTQVSPLGTTSSQWDLAGRRTRLTWPGGTYYVDYDHLVTGETTAIRENGATSGQGVLATLTYDDLGRRSGMAFGNGTSTSYTYDSVSRLASITTNPVGSTYDTTSAFSYSPASQIAEMSRTNDAFAWTGHGSGTSAYVNNGLNQIAALAGTATTYDTKGNLTSDPASGKTFTYSSENLLVSSTGGVSATFSYDPVLRLVSVAGSTTNRFNYDGANRIGDYDGSGALIRRFVHGTNSDEPIAEVTAAGARTWLHADERGSIIARSDSAGSIANINRYDEFGKPDGSNLGTFGFTGQAWLSEPKLWYYKARIYEPALGRFLQPDPIGFKAGPNLYAYVVNDPVNLTDPTGLYWQLVKGVCMQDNDRESSTFGVWLCSQQYIWVNSRWDNFIGRSRLDSLAERWSSYPSDYFAEAGGGYNPNADDACPLRNSFLGTVRRNANDAAGVLFSGAAATGVAGAVPSPFSPGLLASSGGLVILGGVASSTVVVIDFVHSINTGNPAALADQFGAAGAQGLNPGKLLPPGPAREVVGHASNANVVNNWPDMCSQGDR